MEIGHATGCVVYHQSSGVSSGSNTGYIAASVCIVRDKAGSATHPPMTFRPPWCVFQVNARRGKPLVISIMAFLVTFHAHERSSCTNIASRTCSNKYVDILPKPPCSL